ncbi:hypothetical protein FOZ62_013199 [Perkinsus olseni]|uniref:Uncharacterized protein n=1 Tax=Perkinsus olseni TaxID=32597 RepID=A0A7J6TI70_PEROL|nr:hypothetical protein FOZ62_013199 [Perkinsus olseni]
MPMLAMVIEETGGNQSVKLAANERAKSGYEFVMQEAAPLVNLSLGNAGEPDLNCFYVEEYHYEMWLFAERLLWRVDRELAGVRLPYHQIDMCTSKDGIFVGLGPQKKNNTITGWKHKIKMKMRQPKAPREDAGRPSKAADRTASTERASRKRKMTSSRLNDEEPSARKLIRRSSLPPGSGWRPVFSGSYKTPDYSPDSIKVDICDDDARGYTVCNLVFQSVHGETVSLSEVDMRYNKEKDCISPEPLRFETARGDTDRLNITLFGRGLALDKSLALCANTAGGLTLRIPWPSNGMGAFMPVDLQHVERRTRSEPCRRLRARPSP